MRSKGRSLEGRVVLVTRPRARSAVLARLLRDRGAVPLLAPAVELRPAPATRLRDAAVGLVRGEYAWVAFTSPAGVEALVPHLPASSLRARVAAVGDGTASALRDLGVEPDLVPPTFTTESLGRAFPRGSGSVLLPRADIAPDGLESALAAKGWSPVRVDAYRTRLVATMPLRSELALREGRIDAVTLTSASAAEGFRGMAAEPLAAAPRRPRIVCIGPVTARAARRLGLKVDAVAAPHTIEGLVSAVERALGPTRGSESR